MTNSEVIEVLEKEESYMLSHGGDRQAKALRIAIDKMKQEPFINKPCVSSKVCEHDKEVVLDKIRAEIEQKLEQEEFARSVFRHEEKDTAKAEQCTGSIMAYRNVLKMFDKAEAESEEEK